MPRRILLWLALVPLVSFFQNCTSYKAISTADLSQGAGLTHQNVKVFLASGDVARTILSCDDGNTWIKDRSDDDTVRCGVVDCDSAATAGRGLDAGDGWFFANYGWNQNGSLRRSQDGVNWTTLRSDGWGDGVAYVKGAMLLLWSTWFTSSDLGASWSALSNSPVMDHPRIVRSDDTWFAIGQSAPALALSSDQGQTWVVPAGFQPEWTGHIAKANSIIVSLGTDGNEAYSTDGGSTWQTQQLFTTGEAWAGPIFDGSEFVAWAGGNIWRSADAITWTQTPIAGASSIADPVAFNSEMGTYVTVGNSYSAQQAYRSIDGVTWTLLDSTHFPGGHPIHNLVVGDMDSSFCQ